MKFSYNWLQSFFNGKLPKPEKLAELLTMRFAEVEEVKKRGQDYILDIDVRPNRAADCFSHIGIVREIAAMLNIKCEMPENKLAEDKNAKTRDFITVEIKNRNVCPRYTARVICGIEVFSSPKWLKDRLTACGLRPINNIVDIANYIMLETGQPLHAFDFDKLEGRKLIVRFAKKREKIITLDEEKYDLDENILVIADEKKPVAIAGIKGGKIPEISKSTKTIVLESANFDSKTIRCGSRKVNLKTDASLRFEHGLDVNLTEFAINKAAFLIQKTGKGRIARGLLDVYPKKIGPKTISLDLDYIERLLGVKIPEKKARGILEKLGFQAKTKNQKTLVVKIPTRRMDISFPEDLIEEIGRIYGYDKIPAVFPESSLLPPRKNLNIFWEKTAKDIFKELGFSEVYNYSFISEKDKNIFQSLSFKTYPVELKNPLSSDFQYLRPVLIPNLLKNIEKNQENFSRIKIFELGKIFFSKSEKRMLSGITAGRGKDEFFKLKGEINVLFDKLRIKHISYSECRTESVCPAEKCAEIKINGQKIGFLGEVSQKILNVFKIKEKVVLFDLDFEKICHFASEEFEYRPISKFPPAVRDIAILVPIKTKVIQVLNKIYATGEKTVREIEIFDVYRGKEIGSDKKNLAFHIIYQAENRTLTGKEIDGIQKKIIKNLEKETKWQVRK